MTLRKTLTCIDIIIKFFFFQKKKKQGPLSSLSVVSLQHFEQWPMYVSFVYQSSVLFVGTSNNFIFPFFSFSLKGPTACRILADQSVVQRPAPMPQVMYQLVMPPVVLLLLPWWLNCRALGLEGYRPIRMLQCMEIMMDIQLVNRAVIHRIFISSISGWNF